MLTGGVGDSSFTNEERRDGRVQKTKHLCRSDNPQQSSGEMVPLSAKYPDSYIDTVDYGPKIGFVVMQRKLGTADWSGVGGSMEYWLNLELLKGKGNWSFERLCCWYPVIRLQRLNSASSRPMTRKLVDLAYVIVKVNTRNPNRDPSRKWKMGCSQFQSVVLSESDSLAEVF